jgi:Xaa-Pro aminopeptidase|tara:strand:- start:436 stop:1686 length:1251 start_codon:yes stop_codon:yes gene_type:complete
MEVGGSYYRNPSPHVQTFRVPNLSEIDFSALRAGRLARLQQMMHRHQIPICLFYNPGNIRYATGTEVMGVWTATTLARYALVPADGAPIMFEYMNSIHVSEKFVDDVRPAPNWQYKATEGLAAANRWAEEIKSAMNELGCAGEPLAVDKLDGYGFMALQNAGITVTDPSPATVDSREVKTPEEVQLMIVNGGAGDAMLSAFEEAIRPGIREYELMGVINKALFDHHGEFMFTRLIASGTNTNPWMSEAHDKVIQPGDLVGIDTDSNAYEGYVVDISRTFLCGDIASEGQKEAYRIAYDCVNGMRELMKPGMTFEEFGHAAPKLPPEYRNGRYGAMAHQAGLEDEGPGIPYPDDDRRGGWGVTFPNRTIQENMVFCLECYAGKDGAPYGVKLEDQVLVTNDGAIPFSTYPFEAKLLA